MNTKDPTQPFEQESPLEHITTTADEDNITVEGDNFFIERLYNTEILDGKDYISLIKSTERLIRSSVEYKMYIAYLKNDLMINNCTFLHNVHDEVASIEFHHHPFTLFEIVDIVCESFTQQKKKFTSLMIADKVMELHFRNCIGLVPLTQTAHDLVHANKLFINLNQIFGDLSQFVSLYKDYIRGDYKERLQELITTSRSGMVDSGEIFRMNTTYLKDKEPLSDLDLTLIESKK